MTSVRIDVGGGGAGNVETMAWRQTAKTAVVLLRFTVTIRNRRRLLRKKFESIPFILDFACNSIAGRMCDANLTRNVTRIFHSWHARRYGMKEKRREKRTQRF